MTPPLPHLSLSLSLASQSNIARSTAALMVLVLSALSVSHTQPLATKWLSIATGISVEVSNL